MKKLVYIYLISHISYLISNICSAQNPDIKRTYHWYFGNKAGLDFSSGTAKADTNGQMAVLSGCATMSDTSGNLLFYTDGKAVWNKNHMIMNNGGGLNAYGTPRQSSIIVPKPSDNTMYYIFTVSGFENGGALGFRYSEVDMTLDGGLGGVTVNKNILLFAPTPEVVAATRYANCQDTWVVSHERYTNCWKAYKVTNAGVDTNAAVTCIGHTTNASYNYLAKFSPDGTKLAVGLPCDIDSTNFDCINNGSFELYHFDKNSGTLSDVIRIRVDTNCISIEFSPDGSKLYVFSGNVWLNPFRVYQYDLNTTWDSISIASSKQIILPPNSIYEFGDFQISPNNKIILARPYIDSVGIIDNPNISGVACNLIPNWLLLNGRLCLQGLPNFIESYFDTTNCITGINNDLSVNEEYFIIYPNPASQILNLYFHISAQNTRMKIYNTLGILIKEQFFHPPNDAIDISSLSNGIYFIKIETSNNSYSQKLIINH